MFGQQKKMLKRVSNCTIDTCDIFGQLPTFRVLEKGRYTSVVGCCMTFLIGSATLIYLITEMIILIDQAEPSVVQSEKQIQSNYFIQLYSTQLYYLSFLKRIFTFAILKSIKYIHYECNFTLAITIANQNSEPISGNLKYYNITVNQCVRMRFVNQISGSVNVTLNCTILPIAPCTKEDFDNELQQNFFKNTRLGVVQCLNRDFLKRNPPVLQGQISGSVYQYLVIQLSVCKNNTEYQGCAPKEEINNILSAGHYSVYASDYLMQLNNPGQPYSQLINLDINSFSTTTSKMLYSQYQSIQFIMDLQNCGDSHR